jgi:tetratricopeptide (TPR) repeat protein/TolB-like protein
MFREICEGLAAAHERQVLHRDLKPQNILVDVEGHAHITDFGLAKLLEGGSTTITGALVGTPQYMAPEQVRGEVADERADIYALGIILYELLTGSRPFKGNSGWEIALQRLQGPPVPADRLNPEIPPDLQRILDRCLAVKKTDRWGSVAEILAVLDGRLSATAGKHRAFAWGRTLPWRRAGAATAVALLALMSLVLWGRRLLPDRVAAGRSGGATPAGESDAIVVAVMPFANHTGKPELDWYGPGLSRLVADNLAQSAHVRVVSAETTAALKSRAGDSGRLTQAAARDGIDFLLTGEIVGESDAFSASARLTETGQNRETAARRIDGLTEKTLVGAADGLAVAARRGLGIPPTEGVDVFNADFLARNPEAYEDYMKGLDEWTHYHYAEAEAAFRAALAIAPDYTMARYRLAQVLAEVGRSEEALAEIRQAIGEAARLSDRDARYLRASEAYLSRRYEDALKLYTEQVERYPYDIEARDLLAVVLQDTSKYAEAVEQLKINASMEPGRPITWSMLGDVYLEAGDANQAILALRRFIELEPGSANGHHLLGDAYRTQSELDLAAQEYARALEIDPAFHYSSVSLARVDALRGHGEEARRRLARLADDAQALPRHRIDAAFDLAGLLRARGQFREAARVLGRLETPLREEQVREAMALSTRGTSLMEVGDLHLARTLIDKAIERSPGVPTRYLFARGLLELRQGHVAKVRATAAKILEGAPPPDNPSRTADKAAACLTGLASLASGDSARAIDDLTRAVTLSGYEYGIYGLDLGRAYLAAGKLPEALAAARQAAAPLNPAEPRLDLELDRARALILLARIHARMGRTAESAGGARAFLELWAQADPGLPDVGEARKLLPTPAPW